MLVSVSYDDATAAILQVAVTSGASVPIIYAEDVEVEDQLEVSDPDYWACLYGEDDFSEALISDCEVNEERTDIELK